MSRTITGGITGAVIGVIFWAIRKSRDAKRAADQSTVAPTADAAIGSPHAIDKDLAAQVVLVRRALAAGEKLRALAPPGVALAAVDHNLDVLLQARDRLTTMHQPYEGDSLRRLQDVAAQFDALLKQHGGR